jgi:hypothetical protein
MDYIFRIVGQSLNQSWETVMKTIAFAPKGELPARRTVDMFGPVLALSLSLSLVTRYYLLKINPVSPNSRPCLGVRLSAFPARQKNAALFPFGGRHLLAHSLKPPAVSTVRTRTADRPNRPAAVKFSGVRQCPKKEEFFIFSQKSIVLARKE